MNSLGMILEKGINLLFIILGVSIIASIIYVLIEKIVTEIIKPAKLIISGPDIDELINTLGMIIGIEIDTYEKDLFSKRKILDNSSFENYYNDLCARIMNALSESYIERMSYIITTEELGIIIAKYVKVYLSKKITVNELDEDSDK